jgi:hypothetical protein
MVASSSTSSMFSLFFIIPPAQNLFASHSFRVLQLFCQTGPVEIAGFFRERGRHQEHFARLTGLFVPQGRQRIFSNLLRTW